MKQATEVVIIGGGVIGCSLAYNLRKRGVDVIVLDRGEIGGQASNAAAGLLAPLGPLSGPGPFADLLLASFAMFRELVPELEEASGLCLAYVESGAIRAVRNPKRMAALKKRLEAWQPLGLRMYWLNGDEARRQEPLLAPDICAAVYAPEEAQIVAPQVVKAFAQAAQRLGADIYEHVEVTGLQYNANHTSVTGVTLVGKEPIACKHLVIAAGAWSAQCGSWLNLSIPVQPLRGQMLALAQPIEQPLRHIVFGEAAYLVPRDDHIIVGATKEEAGFALEVTDEGTAWLRGSAAKLLPTLAESRIIAHWAGLRPKTPDTRPILGPAPGWENVTIATGHNSVGIMLSALTGQAIADVVTTGKMPELIRPFLFQFQSGS